jgi:hypothetical protein
MTSLPAPPALVGAKQGASAFVLNLTINVKIVIVHKGKRKFKMGEINEIEKCFVNYWLSLTFYGLQ